MKKIPYSRHSISKIDIDSVTKALKSDFLTQGVNIKKFENCLAQYTGAKYAIAVNSATSALIIALNAIELKSNSLVWTTINTFTSSATSALHNKFKIDFVDISRFDYCICPKKLEEKLIQAKKKKLLPSAIVIVHLAGNPCNIKYIHKLSKKYKFKIIEDSSHALGSTYFSRKIGDCKYSSVSIFSFHPVKMITTGEGGALLTNNKKIFERSCIIRSHGIHKNNNKFINKPIWHLRYYEQISLGFNFRLDELSSALGYTQLMRLNKFIIIRNKLANNYKNLLNKTKLVFQKVSSSSTSSYHLFIIDFINYGTKSRNKVFKALENNKVESNIHYIPLSEHPYYQNLGFKTSDYPEAERYYKECLSIPLYVGLTSKQQK